MNARYVAPALGVLALLCLVPILTKCAHAHDWYPQQCCSGHDCEPIPADNIGETEAGWEIDYCSNTRPGLCIKAFFKRGLEKPSRDGGYHACFNSSRVICFFVPNNT
jgi:hypothetical protein